MLKVLYAIMNLFIKQKLYDSIAGALFHCPMFLWNIRSPQVFKNFYDVVVFPSSDFTLVLGSSIEHGGTSAIYIFMAQLAVFNEGVRDHFPICGNFCEVLLVAGGFILFSHAYDNGMGPRQGSGNPGIERRQ